MNKPRKAKILIMDIENGYGAWLAYQPKQEYLNMDLLIKESNILSIAWNWFGERKLHIDSVSNNKMDCDKALLKRVKKVIESADIVVGHNWDAFDKKMIQGRAAENGIDFINFPQSVDTLKVVKKEFRLLYNNLDYVAKVFGVSRKMQTSKGLWRRVFFGDKKALAEMKRYNLQDVTMQAEVYASLLPYIQNHPNMNVILRSETLVCKVCGSGRLHRHGEYVNKTSVFDKYKCQDCGSYTREKKAKKVYNGR